MLTQNRVLILIFFVIFLSIEVNTQQEQQQDPVELFNERPVIGIYTQPTSESWEEYPPSENSYIAASYVKYIEMGGARVVPLPWDADKSTLKYLFKRINGILFTGGSTSIENDQDSNQYTKNAKYLISLAMKANDKGTYFPIWGTCLGFELIGYIFSETKYSQVLSEVGKDNNITHNVYFQNLEQPNSEMVKIFNETQMFQLEEKPTEYYYHHEGILPQTFVEIDNLNENFTTLGVSVSKDSVIFTALYEGKKYPIFATQFHPEKTPFEWKVNANHQRYSIEITQKWANFFVQKSRKNQQSFENEEVLGEFIIYKYPMVQIKESSYSQVYILPNEQP